MNAAYRRLIFVVCILVLAALACSKPTAPKDTAPKEGSGGISSMAVSPKTGRGTFVLTLMYIGSSLNEDATLISCSHPGPDGNPVSKDMVVMNDSESYDPIPYTYTFLVTQPGKYTVACHSSSGGSFTDTIEVTAEEPPKEGEKNEPKKEDTDKISSYGMNFDPAKAVSNVDLGAGAADHPFGCWVQVLTWWPSITVAENGDLSANCTYTSDAGTVFEGTMNGSWDKTSGAVNVHVKDVSTIPQQGKWADGSEYFGQIQVVTTFDGSGSFSSETVAEGTADFSQTCIFITPHEHAPGCTTVGDQTGNKSELKVSGKIPFTFTIFH